MLLVEFEPAIDPIINARAIALAHRIRDRAASGILDVVPGYCTVGVHFDPLLTDLATLERTISSDAMRLDEIDQSPDGHAIEIPVVYGGEAGPDLEKVAVFAGCTTDEVIARHAARTYRVYMLGFVPGFAYMGIAGEQTGVYPVESPGGWQLIGRTTAVLFDAMRSPPNLLAPGGLVRFVPQGGPRR